MNTLVKTEPVRKANITRLNGQIMQTLTLKYYIPIA